MKRIAHPRQPASRHNRAPTRAGLDWLAIIAGEIERPLTDAERAARLGALDADRTPRQAQLDFIRRRRLGC